MSAHDDAVTYTGDIDDRPGHEVALRGRVLEDIDRHDDGIEWRAGIDARDDVRRGIEVDRKPVAGGLLELRSELPKQAGKRAACDQLEFGSFCCCHHG